MSDLDLKMIHGLLREIESLARTASMMDRPHSPVLIATYTRCLQLLMQTGDPLVEQLFPLFGPEATADDVGAAAALMASYVATKGDLPKYKKLIHVERGDHTGHPGHPTHPGHGGLVEHPDLFDLDDLTPPEPPAPPTPPQRPSGSDDTDRG